MSPFLQRPLRSKSEAMLGMLRDTYVAVGSDKGTLYLFETPFQQSLGHLVSDLAEGQVRGAVAVFRIADDSKPADYTEEAAEHVLRYLVERNRTHDEEGVAVSNDFLDTVMPDWISRTPRGIGRIEREWEPDAA